MRVAVVGTCASGKSTIVDHLRRLGYDAFVVSQEHSIVRDLWNHQQPDKLVYLRADFRVIQGRRGASWPRWIYDAQIERLRDAQENASIIVDTSALTLPETIALIVTAISR
jgi:adenylate kinase family enzyme